MKRENKFGLGLAAFIAAGLAWSATRDEAPAATPAQRMAARAADAARKYEPAHVAELMEREYARVLI